MCPAWHGCLEDSCVLCVDRLALLVLSGSWLGFSVLTLILLYANVTFPWEPCGFQDFSLGTGFVLDEILPVPWDGATFEFWINI